MPLATPTGLGSYSLTNCQGLEPVCQEMGASAGSVHGREVHTVATRPDPVSTAHLVRCYVIIPAPCAHDDALSQHPCASLQVRKLALQHQWDYLVVESTGVSVPLPVAATFGAPAQSSEDLQGGSSSQQQQEEALPALSDVARLDTLVTVVDAERWVLGADKLCSCARGLPPAGQTSVDRVPPLLQPQCILLGNLGYPLITSGELPQVSKSSVRTPVW
jgi:hypothetical protein